MKKLLLLLVLGTMFLASCGKNKEVKYRVDATGFEIGSVTLTSNESPTADYYYGNGASELSFEWVGIARQKITLSMTHAENMGEGTLELYADDKLIGRSTGEQPTLTVDRTK